ncbi:MAG: adenylyltransferase/cytidyltransferase family protein [Thermoanaerobaculia bacterium]|nr:adenylyltransferase/cytidyltransferase family protein [Thermoanaerobaculia bacterium]
MVDRAELPERIEEERRRGRTIALANGCFDILHVGHLRYLEGAAAEADVLVVGINADASVRRLKGEGRPVMPEDERAELLAGLLWPDYVVVFAEETPVELIREIRPDVQCKGTDYTEESVPEAEVVRSYGGRIAIVGDPKDHSTTSLIEKTQSKL